MAEVADASYVGGRGSSRVRTAVLVGSISRNAGGLFWSVRSLCEILIKRGSGIHVFGGHDAYSENDRHRWGDVPLSVLAIAWPRAFGYQRGLTRELLSFQPDLLHVQGLWMYPSFAAMRWSGGRRPYLVSPRGMLDPWALRNSGWKKRIAGLLYEDAHLRGAACIHALCDAERETIRAYGLTNPIAVIPNGVHLPDDEAVLPRVEWDANLPEGAKALLFLSRLHPKKGLVGLLDAWAQARQRGVAGARDWHLVIAGWEQGGHQAELERQARELAIEGSVHFVGPQFEAAKAASLRRADAFVLPSFSEGLPMAILEAWSYSLPVMMTPQCNLPEGFAAGAAIRVDPVGESLIDGLATLFGMPDEERHAQGTRGRRLVERQFTWATIGTAMSDVYGWLLGHGPKPDCVRLD